MSTVAESLEPGVPPGFNPVSQEFLDDPQRWLAPARRSQPVFFVPEFNFWAVTRYDDIDRALNDYKTFSNDALAFVPVPDEFADRVPPGFFAKAIISQDPPAHTDRRKLLNRGFARGKMAAMSDPIERICQELIDELEADGEADLMKRYCYEVSLRSIVTLLGLPLEDLPLLRQLAFDQGAVVSEAIKPMKEAERRERWQRIVDARAYLTEIAERRREQPGDDLVSVMVSATDVNGNMALSLEEAVTHLTELVFAGTDTTANLIGTTVRLLDRHPDQRTLLDADPELWPACVEEALRVRSAAAGIFRITTRDVEVAGVTIPARSVAWLCLASAGHDEARFSSPDRFDIRRTDAQGHLSFGKGRHFCMGAPLSRVEAPIALRVLYERLPGITVTPNQTFRYDPILVAVVLKAMHVTW